MAFWQESGSLRCWPPHLRQLVFEQKCLGLFYYRELASPDDKGLKERNFETLFWNQPVTTEEEKERKHCKIKITFVCWWFFLNFYLPATLFCWCCSSASSGLLLCHHIRLLSSFLADLKVVSLHLIGSLTWGTSNLCSAQIYFVLRVSAALVLLRSKLDVLSSQGAA